MEPRLVDIIEELKRQGRHLEADKLKAEVLLELYFKHGLDEHSILKMTIDELEGWYQKPPKPLKYDGWQFYWGKAVNADHSERDV